MPITPTPTLSVPSLAAGRVASSADLNALNTAATFVAAKPMTIATLTAGQATLAATFAKATFSAAAKDDDGLFTGIGSNFLVVQRQGIYAISFFLQAIGATLVELEADTLPVAGPNNPGAAAGLSIYGPDAYCDSDQRAIAANSTITCAGDGVIPFQMFPGDKIPLRVWTNVASTIGSGHFMVRWVGVY